VFGKKKKEKYPYRWRVAKRRDGRYVVLKATLWSWREYENYPTLEVAMSFAANEVEKELRWASAHDIVEIYDLEAYINIKKGAVK